MDFFPPLQEVDEHLRQEALLDALAEVLFRNVGDNKKAPKIESNERWLKIGYIPNEIAI